MASRGQFRYHPAPFFLPASSRRTIVESLKPILLLVVLSGVGYGVYVALNHAPPPEAPANLAPEWNPATGPGAAGSFAGTTNSVEAGGGSSAQPMSNPWLAAPGAANHWDAASAHDSAP